MAGRSPTSSNPTIDIVNKILNGHLPTPEALQQASEPMSDNGASPQPTGSTPRNNIPQAGPLGNARGRYEGPLSGGIVSVPDRPAPEVDSVKMANQLRGNIRDLSEPGAQAMIEAARHYEVLNPVFTEQPQGTTPARSYLFHLIDVAAHKKDDHAQLKAWRAIIPVRPAAQDAPVL